MDRIIKFFKQEYAPLILIAAAIAFSPRFPVGSIARGRSIDLRVEDILLLILGIGWLINFFKKKRTAKKPPLFFPILGWLGIGFITTLINIILGNVAISRGFFYFLKEIEYFFLYFYVFYHLKNSSAIIPVIKTWVIFAAVNIPWIIFQIIFISFFQFQYKANRLSNVAFRTFRIFSGDYLVGTIGENAPLPAGGFFLLLTINIAAFFLFYRPLSKKQKTLCGLIILGLILGILGSLSRTAILAFLGALLILFFLYLIKSKKIKFVFFSVLIIIISLFAFFKYIPLRPGMLDTKAIIGEFDERAGIWQNQITAAFKDHPAYLPFGRGKSVFLTTEESHNQYVRNLVETGIIGSLIFLFLIFTIIKKSLKGFLSYKEPLIISLSAGLFANTIAMLIMAIPAEAFQVVRINEVYWFFTALTMAALGLKAKENYGE